MMTIPAWLFYGLIGLYINYRLQRWMNDPERIKEKAKKRAAEFRARPLPKGPEREFTVKDYNEVIRAVNELPRHQSAPVSPDT